MDYLIKKCFLALVDDIIWKRSGWARTWKLVIFATLDLEKRTWNSKKKKKKKEYTKGHWWFRGNFFIQWISYFTYLLKVLGYLSGNWQGTNLMTSLIERDRLPCRKNPRDGSELIINMTSFSVTSDVNPLGMFWQSTHGAECSCLSLGQ